ncbi:SIR2 family protein [Paenibacillus sp. MY03]|uniref:SIR2 family protein n=1 Tax=Paenibacillus sp. MY03 TaxID=302980 RepID=UPI0015C5AADB|nr:SIR2 family protein [Paenibacillus sp. MY03]
MNEQTFIREFSQKLYDGFGSVFVGSGVSKQSGLPDWYELIQPMVKSKLNIDITRNDDLILFAQYLMNYSGGNRGPLIDNIRQKLRRRYETNPYHQALTWMNNTSLWTTNYDTLLEQAFNELYMVEVKTNDDVIARASRTSSVEIVKMHGCIERSNQDEIVITQEDYEDFFVKRPAISQRLRMDLLHKSFLFVGYSYGDPDTHNILVEARRLSKNAPREHFMIQKLEQDSDKKTRQQFWVNNLRRIGIECLLVNDFPDITRILFEIARRSRGPSIYITGSHLNENNSDFQTRVGHLLAEKTNSIVLDGQSTGASRHVISSFMERILLLHGDAYARIKTFPNPYAAHENLSNNRDLLPVLRQWRADPLKAAQVVLAFDGGMGTELEVETAISLGCFIIPVTIDTVGSSSDFLTKNKKIRDKLQETCPEYLTKAESLQLEPEDVIECIQKVIHQ